MERLKKNITVPAEFEASVREIAETCSSRGYQCYLIGGSVRDLLLGRDVFDYDFATDARPEEITKLFRRTVPTGIKHGTVTVLIGEHSYEITTFRADGKYIDGRRPESVTFSQTLEEDVLRRDFTINGLAYDILTGEIIDHVNGTRDIHDRIIRTIGDPLTRFNEDGLRLMRACRFSAQLDFQIAEETFEAISECSDKLAVISAERIRDEIMKLLEAEKPSIGIECMRETGLLDIVLPDLAAACGVSQNKYHRFDIYHHSLYSCDAAPKDSPMIRLAALFHDIGKVPTRAVGPDGDNTFYNHEVVGARMARRLMKKLKFSNEQVETVSGMVLNHMFHYTDEWTDGAVRRFMRKVGLENMDDLFQLRLADRIGNGARRGLPAPIERLKIRIARILEEENAITVKDLDINGNDIMTVFDLQPGPLVGEILNNLLELVLDDPELNRKEILLEKAREYVEKRTLNLS